MMVKVQAMKKFIEAKEIKGCSYNDIAKAVGDGYPDAPAVSGIFHGKRYASIELMTTIGIFLGLSDIDIQEAFLEQQIIWTKKEIERRNKEIKELEKKLIEIRRR